MLYFLKNDSTMRWLYTILLFPLFLSCVKSTCNQECIRQLAIEHMVDDFYPINWLLRYYARSYYTMPVDFEEFLSFIEDCKEKDPFYSEVEKEVKFDILETITKSKILYASFCDSAFFYLPEYTMGSCVIGTPRFWIESPNLYPDIKSRYETIPPSAFDSSGKFIFTMDYTSLDFFIDNLSGERSKQLLYQEQTKGKMIPLRAIFVYDNRSGSLDISSTIPSNGYLLRRNTFGNDEFIPVSSDIIISQYIHRILPKIHTFFTGNHEVATFFFVADIFAE